VQDPPPSGTPPTQPPAAPATQAPATQAPAAQAPATRPAPPPPAGHGARWGEPGYQAPPDPDRQGRLAVAWIVGILGALGLAVAAVGGFGILVSLGQRQPAPVTGAPPLTLAPQSTVPSASQDPTAPTTGAGSEPSSSGGVPSRSSNAFYSIRIPDGFQDVTDNYRSEHPAERNTVQVLAGQPGSLVTPDATIVIGRLPAGAGGRRSLDRLAADRLRELQLGGAGGASATRHSSIGPDPAVEVDLTVRSAGLELRRTQVLCVHAGRVWEIAVTSPAGSRSLAAAAWTTVKTGWQWR
jgi:hypothetical protein